MPAWIRFCGTCVWGGSLAMLLVGCGGVPDDEDVETPVITDEELPANLEPTTTEGQR